MCLEGLAPWDHRALAPLLARLGKAPCFMGKLQEQGAPSPSSRRAASRLSLSTHVVSSGTQSAIQARGAQQAESPPHPCTHEGDGRVCPELTDASGKHHDPLFLAPPGPLPGGPRAPGGSWLHLMLIAQQGASFRSVRAVKCYLNVR